MVVVSVSRYGHEQGSRMRGMVAQTFGNLSAIHAGHGEIAKDHVRAKVRGLDQCSHAVESGVCFVTPELDEGCQGASGIHVIVNHQNAKGSGVELQRWFLWRRWVYQPYAVVPFARQASPIRATKASGARVRHTFEYPTGEVGSQETIPPSSVPFLPRLPQSR
jgi:hypothetical protein